MMLTLTLALLAAVSGPDPDQVPSYAEIALPTSLASEQGYQQETEPRRERERDSGPKFGLSFGIEGRYSFPFGYANRDVYAVDNPAGGVTLLFDGNLRWNDMFSSGWGTSLIAEIITMQAGRGGSSSGGRGRGKFSAGGYISFSQDQFSGQHNSDGFGNSFSLDDMTMNTYLVGATMYNDLGEGMFMDGRFGIGAVHYSAVSADYNFLFTPPFRGEFFEDTWNFALEVHGGTGFRLGPLAFTLGLGLRMLMPPSPSGTVDIDSGILWTFDITLGIEIGF